MRTHNISQSEIVKLTAANSSLFVIEGHDVDPEFRQFFFPDIVSAVNLASVNGCPYIDIISSYDEKHLEAIFKNKDETEFKKIILTILKRCEGSKSLDQEIDKKIKIPCKKFGSPVLCDLINELDENNVEQFKQKLLVDLAHGHNLEEFAVELDAELKNLDESLQALVNVISAKNLINHLETHPEIDTVYALIGKSHLNILYLIADVKEAEDGYLSANIKLSNRVIEVHFFGGTHGDMTHYLKLARFVEKEGYVIPAENEPFSPMHPSTPKFFHGKFPSELEEAQYKRVRNLNNKLSSILNDGDNFEKMEDLNTLFNLVNDFFFNLERHDHLDKSDINYLSYLETELEDALEEQQEGENAADLKSYEVNNADYNTPDEPDAGSGEGEGEESETEKYLAKIR